MRNPCRLVWCLLNRRAVVGPVPLKKPSRLLVGAEQIPDARPQPVVTATSFLEVSCAFLG